MTNLYPGMLFYSSGLNRKSTPIRPEATPSEIDRKLSRVPFNGRPWPKSSPVSHVYDVRNSSTRMIILNNKLSRKPKGSRLRGQSDHQGEIMHPQPTRHIAEESHTNWRHHKGCTTSVSEKFIPVFPAGINPAPVWVNNSQRPPMKFDNGSGVNPNHHIQCQGHMDYDIIRWYNANRRSRSRTSSRENGGAISPILNDPNLSKGEKKYLSSIARIYSVDNMKVQKQQQYNQLMWKEINKGTYSGRDVEKYNRYLNTPRKTQFGPCDPARNSRSFSAPGSKISRDGDDESRAHTTQTGTRPYRPSRRIASPSASSRLKRMDKSAGKKDAGGKSRSTKKSESLVGKPARKESPLPEQPRKDSVSSLSSLEDEGNDTRRNDSISDKSESLKEDTENKKAESSAEENVEKTKEDSVENKKSSVEIKVDEVKSDEDVRKGDDDDDERSKMSARDTNRSSDEQRGQAVEYQTAFGELESSDGRSKEEVAKSEEQSKQGEDAPSELSQDHSTEKEKPVQKKLSSGDSNGSETPPPLIHSIHKEGRDRPLSRLGGRGEFSRTNKDTSVNSDDDYSDDSEDETKTTKEHDPSVEGTTKMSTESTTVQNNEKAGDETNGKLSQKNVDKMSDLSSKPTDDSVFGGSENTKNGKGTQEKNSPTETSSLPKPSDISTIEY